MWLGFWVKGDRAPSRPEDRPGAQTGVRHRELSREKGDVQSAIGGGGRRTPPSQTPKVDGAGTKLSTFGIV